MLSCYTNLATRNLVMFPEVSYGVNINKMAFLSEIIKYCLFMPRIRGIIYNIQCIRILIRF